MFLDHHENRVITTKPVANGEPPSAKIVEAEAPTSFSSRRRFDDLKRQGHARITVAQNFRRKMEIHQ